MKALQAIATFVVMGVAIATVKHLNQPKPELNIFRDNPAFSLNDDQKTALTALAATAALAYVAGQSQADRDAAQTQYLGTAQRQGFRNDVAAAVFQAQMQAQYFKNSVNGGVREMREMQGR